MKNKVKNLSIFLLFVNLLSTTYLPAKTMDAGIIDTKGEVILYYKENGKIVVKQCEDYTVLNSRSDCKVKMGAVVKYVSVSDFKNSLKRALALSGNYDDEVKIRIEVYNNNSVKFSSEEINNIEKLGNEQKELKEKIARIEAFITEYNAENSNSDLLLSLRDSLSQVEGELVDKTIVHQAIKDIDEKIDNLVDEIVSSDALHKFTFSKNKTSFVFNILRAYLRKPAISASFQRIEKGSFTMGSPVSEKNRGDDEEPKEVIISKPFEIMTTEVTQMQWFLVMGTNPSLFKKSENCDNHIKINGEELCPSNPVERVSYDDVQVYIKKLNDANGLSVCNGTPSDSKGCYRLPTEAEWEYAARGGTKTTYSFDIEKFSLADYAWYRDNADKKTHPVGLKKANPYGLYDMHGNVSELVQDGYVNKLKGGVDPLHISIFSLSVIRGGSWNNYAQHLRSANRGNTFPSFRNFNLGFRLVRTL